MCFTLKKMVNDTLLCYNILYYFFIVMKMNQRVLINKILTNNPINSFQSSTDRYKRNYGIDLLRIFAMINIINLHINGRIGLKDLKKNNIKFKNIWRLQTFSFFAVNCFGLISGIVGFNKYKFSNLIYLWLVSVFYCVNNHLCLFFQNRINLRELLLSFFPILIKFQWYVNAYFIMYLFLPFINLGIKLLTIKTFRNLVYFYIFFFSIYYICSALFRKTDYNFLIGGFSSSWLTILYIIGSYFGKYILENLNKSKIIKFYYFINYIGFSFLSSEIFFITGKRFLVSYLSPTILFQAISLVMLFYSINITNTLTIKIIKFITPSIFSVILIQQTLFSLNIKIVLSLFELIKESNNTFLFFKIYIVSVIIFIFCIIIDFFRLLLFKILKIREICQYIEKIFPQIFDKFLLKTKYLFN